MHQTLDTQPESHQYLKTQAINEDKSIYKQHHNILRCTNVCIMKQVREMEQQIAALQASRDKELEARRWMSSRRHMTNSYGNFNELEESSE